MTSQPCVVCGAPRQSGSLCYSCSSAWVDSKEARRAYLLNASPEPYASPFADWVRRQWAERLNSKPAKAPEK